MDRRSQKISQRTLRLMIQKTRQKPAVAQKVSRKQQEQHLHRNKTSNDLHSYTSRKTPVLKKWSRAVHRNYNTWHNMQYSGKNKIKSAHHVCKKKHKIPRTPHSQWSGASPSLASNSTGASKATRMERIPSKYSRRISSHWPIQWIWGEYGCFNKTTTPNIQPT